MKIFRDIDFSGASTQTKILPKIIQKDIVEESSQLENSLTYDERRMIDMTHQLLNQAPNIYEEEKNISDLMRVYAEVFSDIVSPKVLKSINKSKEIYEHPGRTETLLLSLEKNNAESFLVIPLSANNHMFAAVVRKDESGFRATVVNKSVRDPKTRSKFEDYQLNPTKAVGLFKTLSENWLELDVEQIYKHFDSFSNRKVSMWNVIASEQKSNNCFIKEPENALKFAMATRNFSSDDFNLLRMGKKEFKPKWDLSTDLTHQKFTDKVRSEFPKISKLLNTEYNIYSSNKKFRELLKSGISPENSLIKAFDNEGSYSSFNMKDRKKILLTHVNTDTLQQTFPQIDKIAKEVYSDKEYKMFKDNVDLLTGQGRKMLLTTGLPSDKIRIVLDEVSKILPWPAKQAKYDLHFDYFLQAVEAINAKNPQKGLQCLEAANSFYPYNLRTYLKSGDTLENISSQFITSRPNAANPLLKAAIKKLDIAIKLNPTNGYAFAIRGSAHKMLGDSINANLDYIKAHILSPEIFEEATKVPTKDQASLIAKLSQKEFFGQIDKDKVLSNGRNPLFDNVKDSFKNTLGLKLSNELHMNRPASKTATRGPEMSI